MQKLHFPYKENTLDGVFELGFRARKLNFKYEVNMSTVCCGYDASKCFDGDTKSFCHTDDSPESQWLLIHFKDISFRIEGFAIQNRHDDLWNPMYYAIQASKSGTKFETLETFNDTFEDACGASKKRTRRIKTNKIYRYFRLKSLGRPCYKQFDSLNFNIAEFDLFGFFMNTTLTIAGRKKYHYFLLNNNVILVCFSFNKEYI